MSRTITRVEWANDDADLIITVDAQFRLAMALEKLRGVFPTPGCSITVDRGAYLIERGEPCHP